MSPIEISRVLEAIATGIRQSARQYSDETERALHSIASAIENVSDRIDRI